MKSHKKILKWEDRWFGFIAKDPLGSSEYCVSQSMANLYCVALKGTKRLGNATKSYEEAKQICEDQAIKSIIKMMRKLNREFGHLIE